jgi:hypothetical protein
MSVCRWHPHRVIRHAQHSKGTGEARTYPEELHLSPFELEEDVTPGHTSPRVCEHTIGFGTEVLKRHLLEGIIWEEVGYALLRLTCWHPRVELRVKFTCWHPRVELRVKFEAVEYILARNIIIRVHLANGFVISVHHTPIRLHGVDCHGIVLIEEEHLPRVLVAQRSIRA